MGCSHFNMLCEPQRYEEYIHLSISKEKEAEWRTEQLDEYCSDVIENKINNPLWTVHSSMAEIVETLKTDIALSKMLEITQYIRDRVPFMDRVIVSETINGGVYRQFRTGLIYLAYDLNDISIAKAFVELSLHFSIYEERKSMDLERCQRAIKLCNDIKAELGL
jgi:2-hydroxy-3-keto-5-methylthiopentenyl-1-phosphate phosphatase